MESYYSLYRQCMIVLCILSSIMKFIYRRIPSKMLGNIIMTTHSNSYVWISVELEVPGRSKSVAALVVTLTRAVCCGSKAKPDQPA